MKHPRLDDHGALYRRSDRGTSVLALADVLSARSTSSQRIPDHYNSGAHFHKIIPDRYLVNRSAIFSSASFIIFGGTKNVRVQSGAGPSRKHPLICLTLICEIQSVQWTSTRRYDVKKTILGLKTNVVSFL